MTSPLRDLAAQIEDVARRHPAYSQAWQPVRTLVDHLCALARVEETNATGPVCRRFKTKQGRFYTVEDEAAPL